MKAVPRAVRARRRVAIDAALVLLVVLLMTQMWLLTATLESYLAGHQDAALPGMIMSGVMFAGCLALYRLVVRLDRSPEPEAEPTGLSGPWQIR
jgi:hypothetical protein